MTFNPQAGRNSSRSARVTSFRVSEVVTKASPLSVSETVARVTDLIAARGLKQFTVIDHSGEAKAHGLELRDTKVVMFGNPEAGTPVMAAAPHERGCELASGSGRGRLTVTARPGTESQFSSSGPPLCSTVLTRRSFQN